MAEGVGGQLVDHQHRSIDRVYDHGHSREVRCVFATVYAVHDHVISAGGCSNAPSDTASGAMNDMMMDPDEAAPAESSAPPDSRQTTLSSASWQPAVAPVTDLPAALARIEQLEQAMVSNRAISMVVGILMERHHVDADTAIAELRRISQHSNVRLAVVATMLLENNN